jgi:glycosyltransferase involved in cell wall biosynthesis
MRVLVVHNRYRSEMPSGENRVVDDEVEMLREAGVEVETFFRDSDDLDELGALRRPLLAVSPTYSASRVRDFKKTVARFQPSVVHLHNPFPLISPAIIRPAKSAGAAVVQTVHNYRHSCVAGTHFRDSAICELCPSHSVPWPSVLHGCYRGSRAQSAAMATSAMVHRSTWRLVDLFIAVSERVATKLNEHAGVPSEKIVIKANSVRDPGSTNDPGDTILFAARLEEAKGVRLLLDAWNQVHSGLELALVVAGDGPLQNEVSTAARTGTFRYLGPCGPAEMNTLLRQSRAVCVPSLWYEGLPTIALEAFAHGRGVITTNLGALSCAAYEDAVWSAEASTEALGQALCQTAAVDETSRKGRAARALYLQRFAPEVVSTQLRQLYHRVSLEGSSA